MKSFEDSYSLLPDAQQMVARLVTTTDTFPHLVDARLACVSSQRVPMLHGSPCQAFVALPKVQGPFHWLFDWFLVNLTAPLFDREDPDFVILFDVAAWALLTQMDLDLVAAGEDPVHCERLCYHELRHIVPRTDEYGVERRSPDDGRILLKLQPHDFEFFADEVARYGPVVCSLEDAAIAIADGLRRAEVEQETV